MAAPIPGSFGEAAKVRTPTLTRARSAKLVRLRLRCMLTRFKRLFIGFSLLKKTLEVEPIRKTLDPMVRGEILFSHPKAMTAFGEQMKFGLLLRTRPIA